MFYRIFAEAITGTKADWTEITVKRLAKLKEQHYVQDAFEWHLKEKALIHKYVSLSGRFHFIFKHLSFAWKMKKPMKRDVAANESEYKKAAGPSVQPSSFVVLSSRSSSLSKSLWSLLAMVFLLLSSSFPFFSCTGNGFTGYRKRKQDEPVLHMLQLLSVKTLRLLMCVF